MQSGSLSLEEKRPASQREMLTAQLLWSREQILNRIKSDALWWLRNCTKTHNPQWLRQGFDGAYQPFPKHEYLDYLFDYLQPRERMKYEWLRNQVPPDPQRGAYERVVEKSRTMLGTWACVGKLTHQGMTVRGQEFIFQSQTQDKAEELIDYAKILWDQQESWLKDEFPLDRKLQDFPKNLLRWAHGSRIIGIPNDPDKIRMYHPTGVLMDESAFMSDFKANRETAIHACHFIIELSSAGPSEFGNFVNA